MSDGCHGLLVIDKPAGVTSRAALDRCQGWFPRGTALGHTGTLDPLATGVLVVCVGVATRLAEYVQRMTKTYRATFQLGATSDSDDADGRIVPTTVERLPDREEIERALRTFVGDIEQVPPAYSAAKVTGRRAYKLARRGQAVELAPRRVHIYAIDQLAYAYPRLDLRVHCGKGTYIRSLARDLGERLGCGAYVETLRRERVGSFTADQAITPEAGLAEARGHLLPLSDAVVDLPALVLEPAEVQRLRHGQRIALPTDAMVDESMTEVAVFDANRALAMVARVDWGSRQLAPYKVMPPS
jgi:tRNA pseudouridine55 synthase